MGQICFLKILRFSPVIISPLLRIHSIHQQEPVLQKCQEYEPRLAVMPDDTLQARPLELLGKCLRSLEAMMLQIFRVFLGFCCSDDAVLLSCIDFTVEHTALVYMLTEFAAS